ncbi:TPM domain-containing protein [Methylicorpusculum oleiharenae]|uniref:TPM domain-containing protein n=1 Tax=Methylicorpusculum oleiharenae TaxID=1338687 RepID=UPI00135865C6|nr:TPM domain-containing protein [Methylicorpusculum oleiharenae]MCD2451738.1 TPM domain-containing protein [Methylicorpusculum oleiharenae]
MVNIKRWFIHAFMPPWRWRVAFPASLLGEIDMAVEQSESLHRGELRFAIENALAPSWVWQGMSASQRATEVFSNLRVWDTEENSGVLIYLLLADREVDLVVDRGIAKLVPQAEWDTIAEAMQKEFHRGDFRRGALEGIERITKILATHFPSDATNKNELSNTPVIVKR